MARRTLHIHSESERQKALKWLHLAPLGFFVTFKRNKRSVPQNDRMWAMLGRVSEQLLWHGQHYPDTWWKDYFMHELRGGSWMPHENGGMVPVGMSTSELTTQEHSDLTMLIEAFAARHGVDLNEPQEKAA